MFIYFHFPFVLILSRLAMRAVQSTATRVKQFRQSNQITAKD